MLLTERLKMASEKLSKMTNLAEMSSSGNLSSFSGVFRVSPLTPKEQGEIKDLLSQYKEEEQEISGDLEDLLAITSEVKAINNQAAILHGERIKKAQHILKRYRDGAFSAWLVQTYGNRQTPYNFLQYYDLYTALPQMLASKLDSIPRQALYTLASREGPLEMKEDIIKNYQGETKQELLDLIRKKFPLAHSDRRAQDFAAHTISALSKLRDILQNSSFSPSKKQKKVIKELLKDLSSLTDSRCGES
jgi:RecG-like helicase